MRRLRTETATANYFNFHLELNASFIRYPEVEVWRRMRRQTYATNFEILIKGRNLFFNRGLPWRCRPDCLRSLVIPKIQLMVSEPALYLRYFSSVRGFYVSVFVVIKKLAFICWYRTAFTLLSPKNDVYQSLKRLKPTRFEYTICIDRE